MRIRTYSLLVCALLIVETFAAENDLQKKRSNNITTVLNNILKGYDKRLRPFLNEGKPATVTLGMWIMSIDSINIINMDYRIDFFFRQAWKDPRLRHSYPQDLTLENSMLSKLWIPDTYFTNSKSSNFHFVTVPNKMLRIAQDGSVDFNCRISLQASCPMDLRDFPIDILECHLHIESYGYDVTNIEYLWEEESASTPVSIAKKFRNLAQYTITDLRTTHQLSGYVLGKWSSLKIHFNLVRKSGYAFLHLYAPCILIVMLSWIAFFIPVDSIAARIALGITSVLTTTTILNIQNNSMPKVSYIKLSDWYLIACFLFVFGTLFEFTIILFLNAKAKRQELEKNDEIDALAAPFGLGSALKQSVAVLAQPRVRVKQQNRDKSVPSIPASSRSHTCTILGRKVKFKVHHIDSFSRILFPTSFLLFNIGYWYIFLTTKNLSGQ